jgi:hypothetical protein
MFNSSTKLRHITFRPIQLARPAALAAAAAGLSAPLLLFSPSHAATTEDGCTVTPHRPAYSGVNNAHNIPLVDYKITVACDPDRTIFLDQVRMEQDLVSREGEAPDDTTGTWSKNFDFTNGGTKNIKVRVPLPDTGPANEGAVEEVYQKVRFEVTTNNGVDGGLTDYELTTIRSIHR